MKTVTVIIIAITLITLALLSQSSWARPRVSSSPAFTLGSNPVAPLAGELKVATTKPTRATVTLQTNEKSWTLAPTGYRRRHHLPVIGFAPQSAGTLTAEMILEDQHGHTTQRRQSFAYQAPALPDNFPPIQTTVSNPDAMEPGLTLFNVFQWRDGTMQEDISWIIAVDNQGQIRWYYQSDRSVNDVKQLANGNILFTHGHRGIKEITPLGVEVGHWFAANHLAGEKVPASAIPVAIDTFHHEITELPNGNLLTLSTEVRQYPDYPQKIGSADKTPKFVVGDQIVEFTRQGEIVHTINLLDILDPYRLSYSSLAPLWDNWAYPDLKDQGGTADWAHANAVAYHPEDDSYLVSLRHQDAVVKISRSEQSLQWILGNHDNWNDQFQPHLLNPTNSTESLIWPYHQHAPELTPQGTILLFDNGNFKATPPAPPIAAPDNYSRAVEYKINEENGTIDQVWSYGGPATPNDQFYSPFVGDADVLPQTNNVLITDGGRAEDTNGKFTDNIQQSNQWGRIIEVARQAPAQKVFELTIHDEDPALGWTIYRADRIPEL